MTVNFYTPIEWVALQKLPTIEVTPAFRDNKLVQVGWQSKTAQDSSDSISQYYVMPSIYNLDIPTYYTSMTGLANLNGIRRLSVQYAPNSTLATIPQVITTSALLSSDSIHY